MNKLSKIVFTAVKKTILTFSLFVMATATVFGLGIWGFNLWSMTKPDIIDLSTITPYLSASEKASVETINSTYQEKMENLLADGDPFTMKDADRDDIKPKLDSLRTQEIADLRVALAKNADAISALDKLAGKKIDPETSLKKSWQSLDLSMPATDKWASKKSKDKVKDVKKEIGAKDKKWTHVDADKILDALTVKVDADKALSSDIKAKIKSKIYEIKDLLK